MLKKILKGTGIFLLVAIIALAAAPFLFKDKIKELEAQLLTLRIENAYLKELRKLREQEEKQRMKLSRPSYLASEENSN